METKKWEISCDGWYPYCPVCKQETLWRTPVCMNCGTRLEENEEDMRILRKHNKDLYKKVMDMGKIEQEGACEKTQQNT